MEVSTRGIVFNDETEIRYVPWFSMSEWKTVYHQIYSENLEDRKKGLESLQIWKARSTSLPYAVECTHMILRIQIKDDEQILNRKIDELPLDEDDICMMYCTAITRFLNQILTVDHKKGPIESMYKLASRMLIPQWVVKLRHDASHGTNLPSLQTMRDAACVAMKWLNDNYWLNEEENITDYVPSKQVKNRASILTQLVDTRQSTYLFTRTGYYSSSHIPDKSLRRTLFKLKQEFLKENPNYKDSKVKRWKLKHSITFMDKRIYLSMTDESHAKELLDVVLSSEGFFIDEDVLKLYEVTRIEGELVTELPSDLLSQWRDMIGILHCAQLIPELIEKLVHRCCSENEKSFDCNITALWLNEIARSVLKLRQIQNILVKSGISLKEKISLSKYASYRISLMSGDITSNDGLLGTLEKDAQQQVLKDHPSLASAISLPSSVAAPSSEKFIDIVKKAAFAPNKCSLLYMQSLVGLLEGELSDIQQEKMLHLVSTYLGYAANMKNGSSHTNMVHPIANGTNVIHSVADIQGTAEECDNHQSFKPTSSSSVILQPKDSGDWIHYTHSEGHWMFGCGLGRLPWQHDLSCEDFMLPQDWVPWHQSTETCIDENHSPDVMMDMDPE